MSEKNLGDGFSRRKQIQTLFGVWLNRLSLSGREEVRFTSTVLGDSEDKAIAGTLKKFGRNFTIEECLSKLEELIKEDKGLAKRISLTNQQAKAPVEDLEGNTAELTIPELIVLKNDIIPKLEEITNNIPTQTTGVEIIETVGDAIKWRTIKTLISRTRKVSKEGFQLDVDVITGYNVKKVVDYGYSERKITDRNDKLQAYVSRVKIAINEANKTLLINL